MAFKLRTLSASFLQLVAHPANFIYAKKHLDQDKHYYKTNVMGTGPFMLENFARANHLKLVRNSNYFREPPYVDRITFLIIRDQVARTGALEQERVHMIVNRFAPAEAETITKRSQGRIIAVPYEASVHWGVAINVSKKPFDDVRVRKALMLAINRGEIAEELSWQRGLSIIGGLMPPHTLWALDSDALRRLVGFGKDPDANISEAKQLLAEAHYPNGFSAVLTIRDSEFWSILGTHLISSWRRIGVMVTPRVLEFAALNASRSTGDFELLLDSYLLGAVGAPDDVLYKFTSNANTNWGRFSIPEFDKLYEEQMVTLEPQRRIALVKAMQQTFLEQVGWIPGLWWKPIELYSSRIKNYTPPRSYWMDRPLNKVWLEE